MRFASHNYNPATGEVVSVEYDAAGDANLIAVEETTASKKEKKEKKKASKLTVKMLAENSKLPEGRDFLNESELQEFMGKVDLRKPIAFDTETSYNPAIKNAIHLSQTMLRFVQFSQVNKHGKNITVICRVNEENIDRIAQICQPLLTNPKAILIIHNATFDAWIVNRFLGYRIKARIIDTLVLSRFYYLGRQKNLRHSLDACAKRELDIELTKEFQASDWRLPIEPERHKYMANDVEVLTPLYKAIMQRFTHDAVEQPGLLTQLKLELHYAYCCREIHLNGMRADLELMRSELAARERKIAELQVILDNLLNPDKLLPADQQEKFEANQRVIAECEAKLITDWQDWMNKCAANCRVYKEPATKGLLKRIASAKARNDKFDYRFKFKSPKQKTTMLRGRYRDSLFEYFRVNALKLMREGSAYKIDIDKLADIVNTVVDTPVMDRDNEFTDVNDNVDGDSEYDVSAMDEAFHSFAEIVRTDASNQAIALTNALNTNELEAAVNRLAESFADVQAELLVKSSSAGNIKKIRAIIGEDDNGVLATLLDLMKAEKQRQMIESYITMAELSPSGDRLHSIFRSLGADTGRTSSTAPNQQNIPRGSMRKMFIPSESDPENGKYTFMAVLDYSQVEWRVAAQLADERVALDAFADGKDLHTITAIMIWGDECKDILLQNGIIDDRNIAFDDLYEEVYYFFNDDIEDGYAAVLKALKETKTQAEADAFKQTGEYLEAERYFAIKKAIKQFRQLAKSANFGLLFGAGWKGLQGYIFNSSGKEISEEEARKIRTAFFTKYSGLNAWHKGIDKHMKEQPAYIMIAGLVRRWTLPVYFRDGNAIPNPNLRLTVGANTPVQGIASIIAKRGISKLFHEINRSNIEGVMPINIVHDEVVLEITVSASSRDEAIELAEVELAKSKRCLEEPGQELLDEINQAMNEIKPGRNRPAVTLKSSGGLCTASGTWNDK